MSLLQTGIAKSGAADVYTIDNSCRFNGTGEGASGDYLTRTTTGAGSGSWTLSTWVKPSNLSDGTWSSGIFGAYSSSTATQIYFESNDKIRWYENGGDINATARVFRDPSAWYHLVFQKNGSTSIKIYVNGELADTDTTGVPATSPATNSGATVYVGQSPGTDGTRFASFCGYQAEVYFIDGSVLEPTSFAETDSTTNQWIPIDAVDDLTFGTNGFYQKYGGTELADSFVDSSSSDHTITAVGDVTNTRAVKKIGDSSIKFDGSGDYLSCPDSADWDFLPASAYTVETWFKAITHAGTDWFIGQGVDGNNYWMLGHEDGAGIRFESYSGGGLVLNITGGEITDTDWHHIALVRDGSDVEIFKDGSSVATGTTSSTATFSGEFRAGQGSAHGAMDGYLDEIRLSNVARYTTTFTPSTTAFTPDANTLLLIHSNWDGGLGADSSGNYNTFTPTNLVATDQMIDTPTNNFAVINPLQPTAGGYSYVTKNGNLELDTATGGLTNTCTFAVLPLDQKWYYECVLTVGTAGGIGIIVNNETSGGYENNRAYQWKYLGNTGVTHNSLDSTSYTTVDTTTFSVGDVVAIMVDGSSGDIKFYKSGSLIYTATDAITAGNSDLLIPSCFSSDSQDLKMNFGADASFSGTKSPTTTYTDANGKGEFFYQPPTGALALCTSNLPSPEIALPGDNFNTVLYAGNAGSNHAITGVGFQSDFTWIKVRGTEDNHFLTDSPRSNRYGLSSNTTAAANSKGADVFDSFDSDGFTVTHDPTYDLVNRTSQNYVAWNWKAGGAPTADNSAGAGATPTAGSVKIDGSNLGSALAGSIAATRLSANTTSGFSIVYFTGTEANATVGHGLSQAPTLVINKVLGSATHWYVNAVPVSDTSNKVLNLNDTAALDAGTLYYNDTNPTSTVVSLGTYGNLNSTGLNIMYCFHSVEGYSKVGTYVGNGNANGSFVYTGFLPKYIMWKRTDSADNWTIEDSARSTYNGVNWTLEADSTIAEWDDSNFRYDFVSNGIKMRNSFTQNNASGGEYLYVAFAESPFKYSNAR